MKTRLKQKTEQTLGTAAEMANDVAGTLFESRWYLRVMAQTWWVGFVAVIAGWVVTESGRQPWIVQGIMRTADAASPVHGGSVLTTLILFVIAYGVVFSFGIYYINRLIAKGLDLPDAHEGKFSKNTMSAAPKL